MTGLLKTMVICRQTAEPRITSILKIRKAFFLATALVMTSALPQISVGATEVGPFLSLTDADLYAAQIIAPTRTQSRVEQLPVDYIIVSDSLGPQLGQALLLELRSKGIDDVVYVRTGEFGGKVSAGVYLRLGPSAQRRLSRLQDEGFSFQALPREIQKVTRYWVSTNADATQDLVTSVEQLVGYSLELEVIPEFVADNGINPVQPGILDTEQAIDKLVINESVTGESSPQANSVVDSIAQPLDLNESVIRQAPLESARQEAEPPGPDSSLTEGTLIENELAVPSSPRTSSTPAALPEKIVTRQQPESGLANSDTSPAFFSPFQWSALLAAVFLIGIIVFFMMRARQAPPTLLKPEEQASDPEPVLEQSPIVNTETINEPKRPQVTEGETEAIEDLTEIPDEEPTDLPAPAEVSGRNSLDLISDLVVLEQNKSPSTSLVSIDLAALMVTVVNNARSLHQLSTIKYRATSILPAVFGDPVSIDRLLSIIIQKAVSLDDVAHILIQAEYQQGAFTLSCLNESALLNEDELQQVRDSTSQVDLRLKTADELATRMQGKIEFSSKFGFGTDIRFTAQLPLSDPLVTLNNSDINELIELRMRLIKSREVSVPAARAGIAALAAHPATTTVTSTLNGEIDSVVTAMNQQLNTVELAEQQAVSILEKVISLAQQNRTHADDTIKRIEQNISRITAELATAVSSVRAEPGSNAFPPYGSKDDRGEFFTQLKNQLQEIEIARAEGDMQTLSRIARWTSKYTDGLGMSLVSSQFRTVESAMRQGNERLMIEALTSIQIGLSRLKTETPAATSLAE